MPLAEVASVIAAGIVLVLLVIMMTNASSNFFTEVIKSITKTFDAQPQGDQQPESKPSTQMTALEALENSKKQLEQKYKDLHEKCNKEIVSALAEEINRYHITDLSSYIDIIKKQFDNESSKACDLIYAKYRPDAEKFAREAKNILKSINKADGYTPDGQQRYRCCIELFDKSEAVYNLIFKMRKESDQELLKKYPHDMLSEVLETAKRDYEWRRQEISEEIRESYEEEKRELMIEIETISIKIERLKNPQPESESPFQIGQDMHDFTEQLTYSNDGPDKD